MRHKLECSPTGNVPTVAGGTPGNKTAAPTVSMINNLSEFDSTLG